MFSDGLINSFPMCLLQCTTVTDDIPMFFLSAAGRSSPRTQRFFFSRNLRTDKRISDRQLGFDFKDSVPRKGQLLDIAVTKP